MKFEIQKFAGDGGTYELGYDQWLYFICEAPFDQIAEDDSIAYGTEVGEVEDDSVTPISPFWGFATSETEYAANGTHGGTCIRREEVQLKIYGLASLNGTANAEGGDGVRGNTTAITATAAGELSDILVEGDNKTSLTITIDGTAYPVLANGRIVSTLPDFGLMTKADKQKLDRIPDDFSNFITSGVMTANGFVLTNNAGEGVVTIPAQA